MGADEGVDGVVELPEVPGGVGGAVALGAVGGESRERMVGLVGAVGIMSRMGGIAGLLRRVEAAVRGARSMPRSSATATYIASRIDAVALIVIEVFICSSGISSKSVRMSPRWQTGTPTLPTSPRART